MPREEFELLLTQKLRRFSRLCITITKCSQWLWWGSGIKLKVVGVIQLLLSCYPEMLQLLDLVCRILLVYKQLQLVRREEEGSVCSCPVEFSPQRHAAVLVQCHCGYIRILGICHPSLCSVMKPISNKTNASFLVMCDIVLTGAAFKHQHS